MDTKLIGKFFEALSEIISADGAWVEKRIALKQQATADDLSNLNEFISWFENDAD